MTVSAQTTYNTSIGNGVTTVFPYTFKITDEDDLKIILDGVEQTSGFVVTGVGNESGGSVTFTVAPSNGVEVVRIRAMTITRSVDYQEGGDLLAETLDADIDRAFLVMQQIQEGVDRAYKQEEGSGAAPVFPSIVPTQYVRGTSDGLGLEFASPADWASPGGSDTVGFIQNGNGATNRTVQDKLREIVSVKDFGALGNGTTNDSASIQLAMESDAEEIVFPDGSYVIGSNLTLDKHVTLTAGAVLVISGGVTVVFAGGFSAHRKLAFTGSGVVSFSSVASPAAVFPEWWGAVADGVTDSGAAINKAIVAVGRGSVDLLPGTFGLSGTTLTIGAGAYYSSVPIELGRSYVALTSSAIGKFVIGFPTVNAGVRITDDAGFSEFATLSNGILVNLGTPDFTTDLNEGVACFVSGTQRTEVKDMRFLGWGKGSYALNTVNLLIQNCKDEAFFGSTGYKYGFVFDGAATNSAAISSNASARCVDCLVSQNASEYTGVSNAFHIVGRDIRDVFLVRPESANTSYGINVTSLSGAVTGGTTQTSQDFDFDIQIDTPILDGVKIAGIVITDLGKRGGVNVSGGWVSPQVGVPTAALVQIDNSSNVTVSGVELFGSTNANTIGFNISNSAGFVISENKVRNCKSPFVIAGASYGSIQSNNVFLTDDYFARTFSLGNSNAAFVLSSASSGVTIGGNAIRSANQEAGTVRKFAAPIQIDSGCTYNAFAYNTVDGSAVVTASTNNGGPTNVFAGAYY